MHAQTPVSTFQQQLAKARAAKAANDAAAAGQPAPVQMTDDEIRTELERGVSANDMLDDMCARGESREEALARLDAIRGVGRVGLGAAQKLLVDIDDLFADLPDAAVLARLAALDLNCEPSIMAPTMLAVAAAAICGQVNVVLPPEAADAGGSDFLLALNQLRAKEPFEPALTTYLVISAETGLRKSEAAGWAGSDVLFGFNDDLKRAWAPQPGEAKVDAPKYMHARATPVGLEFALLEHGAAFIVADEGEDCLRGFLAGGEGKDNAGLLLTAKVGKFWDRTVGADRTCKKALVVRTNFPRLNMIACVQDCFFEAENEDDRKQIQRMKKRGLFARMDIAEMVQTDAATESVVKAGLERAWQRDRRVLETAKSRWRERLRNLLPQVRPDGDRHPIAMTLGSVKATLTAEAAAVIHRIDRESRGGSEVADFMRRAHINVAQKAALLALLRAGRLQDVSVTLADVQRAERFVMGYLRPIYVKMSRHAAATVIEADSEKVYTKICELASRDDGSTTDAKVLDALGRIGWGAKDDRNKGMTRLEFALQALAKADRIVRRKVGKARRIYPIGGAA